MAKWLVVELKTKNVSFFPHLIDSHLCLALSLLSLFYIPLYLKSTDLSVLSLRPLRVVVILQKNKQDTHMFMFSVACKSISWPKVGWWLVFKAPFWWVEKCTGQFVGVGKKPNDLFSKFRVQLRIYVTWQSCTLVTLQQSLQQLCQWCWDTTNNSSFQLKWFLLITNCTEKICSFNPPANTPQVLFKA